MVLERAKCARGWQQRCTATLRWTETPGQRALGAGTQPRWCCRCHQTSWHKCGHMPLRQALQEGGRGGGGWAVAAARVPGRAANGKGMRSDQRLWGETPRPSSGPPGSCTALAAPECHCQHCHCWAHGAVRRHRDAGRAVGSSSAAAGAAHRHQCPWLPQPGVAGGMHAGFGSQGHRRHGGGLQQPLGRGFCRAFTHPQPSQHCLWALVPLPGAAGVDTAV